MWGHLSPTVLPLPLPLAPALGLPSSVLTAILGSVVDPAGAGGPPCSDGTRGVSDPPAAQRGCRGRLVHLLTPAWSTTVAAVRPRKEVLGAPC